MLLLLPLKLQLNVHNKDVFHLSPVAQDYLLLIIRQTSLLVFFHFLPFHSDQREESPLKTTNVITNQPLEKYKNVSIQKLYLRK